MEVISRQQRDEYWATATELQPQTFASDNRDADTLVETYPHRVDPESVAVQLGGELAVNMSVYATGAGPRDFLQAYHNAARPSVEGSR